MMLFPGSLRVFIALEPCDMRSGINTLHALVADRLREDTLSGVLFMFINKRRRLLKVLYWDGTGIWLMTKHLEQGMLYWPQAAEDSQTKLELAQEALHMLTGGIDMHGAKPRCYTRAHHPLSFQAFVLGSPLFECGRHPRHPELMKTPFRF
jgi:transposase